ncbi:MAG: DUF2254 domain-containing protein [Deltaproteobacteria bacterium]|nr:DUF2254 domain-containing protein [Deltaproteobacteria bacterium]
MKNSILKKKYSFLPFIAFVVIGVISALIAFITGLYDFAGSPVTIKDAFFHSIESGALGNMPEVIIGVLGLSVTVVAIIVELASNRYTPKITELFMASIVNISILGFFVVTGVVCVWESTISASDHVPILGAIVTTVLVLTSLLLLLPYFAYVFHFLNPHNIIDRMASTVFSAIQKGGLLTDKRASDNSKKAASYGIEQLADVASGAIESKDKVVSMHAASSLGKLAEEYVINKDKLAESWFLLNNSIKENPDFVSMQADVIKEIEKNRIWVEMKILRQFQDLYGISVNKMRDINYLLAIHTRKIAQKAAKKGDTAVVKLCVKFFNTYLRVTINANDVRTAYNVLNQYRIFAEEILDYEDGLIALDIARMFKYYGQLAFNQGLAFILETAAYDLCALNELAYAKDSKKTRELLDIFLDVDKEAEENHQMEASLRGVRKAQIKLAVFYLTKGETKLAKVIFEDMKDEIPSRLTSIREEFSGINSKDFWEINDRGVNFDYLEKERIDTLDTFFSWFNFDKSKGGE